MIPLSQISRRAGKMITDNSPVILSSAAVAGVLSTAILAAKGSFKAAHILENQDPTAPIKEQAELIWKCYIPAAATGVATIACIIGAQQISSKRQAAALGLYTLSETAFKEYKDKVVEQIGVNKEQKVRDEIVQDRVTETAPSSTVVIVEEGDVLCVELMTNTYFRSNKHKIERAAIDVNQMIQTGDMYASHNDFLNRLGLESNGMGEQVGWSIENLIELQFSSALSPDGTPCLAFGYSNFPKVDYHKFG